jgi:outer membrane protein TolC
MMRNRSRGRSFTHSIITGLKNTRHAMKKFIYTGLGLFLAIQTLRAQADTITLSLNDALRFARVQSLQTFLNKHNYLVNYWNYRSFKADYLPLVDLSTNPVSYSNASSLRYNSTNQTDEYIRTESLSSDMALNVSQKLPFTGGTFYVKSQLDRIRNYGSNSYTQYSAVPLSVGYTQELFGFNSMKWERKIEPLKYEKAKKGYIQSMEEMNISTVEYFFAMAKCQIQKEMALSNFENAGKLVDVARQRFKLGTVTREELLDLKLSQNNAKITLQETEIELREARENLLNFLLLPMDARLNIELPDDINLGKVNVNMVLEKTLANSPKLIELEQNILENRKSVASARANQHFQANLNVSYGISKTDGNYVKNGSLADVYQPEFDNQQYVSVGVTIPILDWGENKGKYQMARSQQKIAEISARQNHQDLERHIVTSAMAFNILKSKLETAALSDTLAFESYQLTMDRFMTGKADVLKLTTSQKAKDDAHLQYLNVMSDYWYNYYYLRSLALYDFEKQVNITFDESDLLDSTINQPYNSQ